MQQIVGVGLVGRDRRPRGDEARRQGADIGLIFPGDDERQGALAADPPGQIIRRVGLAHHQDTALVGVLMFGQAPIHPVLGPVGGAYRATDIAPVDLHLTRQRRLVALVHEALTQLVHQHEGGLVLHVQIPAQLQRRQAFDRIGVDRDGPEVDLQRQLVVGKDGPGGHREGVPTVPAAPLPAAGQKPMLRRRPRRPDTQAPHRGPSAPRGTPRTPGRRSWRTPRAATGFGPRPTGGSGSGAWGAPALDQWRQCAPGGGSNPEPPPKSLMKKLCAVAT